MDLFGEDSEGDDIPCGQQENIECLSQLAEQLGSQGHGWEDLLPPPILTRPIQPQPQPAPSVPPVLDITALVAALKEVTPPPPPPATRDDTVTPGNNSVTGGNLSKVGEAGCSREETKVSPSISVEALASPVQETSPL